MTAAILPDQAHEEGGAAPTFPWKLWIYTNYDCNLRCTYCVAKSSPNAPRRAIGLANARQLVDEAVALGFEHIFFTGGEPFVLPDIYAMLAHSSARVPTTVLTNAMLLRGARLEKLIAIGQRQPDRPGQPRRRARGGPRRLPRQGCLGESGRRDRAAPGAGFRVRLGTTETPANAAHLDRLHAFREGLGIPAEDHFIRPLAKRGHSKEGLDLGMGNLLPELTANLDGLFWHPLSTDADMQVSKKLFPLERAVRGVQHQLDTMARTGGVPLLTFT